MGKKVSFDAFCDSHEAIRKYRESKGSDGKAKVIISSNGQVKFNDNLDIHIRTETNYSFIDINGDDKFNEEYYIRYNNEYQIFSYSNGILTIEGEDKAGDSIKIEIIG